MLPQEVAAKIIKSAREVYENHADDGAWIAMERAYADAITKLVEDHVAAHRVSVSTICWLEDRLQQIDTGGR